MVEMSEPHASEFRRLIREGAGARDIHGPVPQIGFAERTLASDAYVAREVARVEAHRMSSCALLEAFTGRAPRILDVGCSTGGGAVAMALSPILARGRRGRRGSGAHQPEGGAGPRARPRPRGAARVVSRLPSGQPAALRERFVRPRRLRFGSGVRADRAPAARPRRRDEARRASGRSRVSRDPEPLAASRSALPALARRLRSPRRLPMGDASLADRRLLADFEPVRVHRWVGERTLERAGLPAGRCPRGRRGAGTGEQVAEDSRAKARGWAATCSL